MEQHLTAAGGPTTDPPTTEAVPAIGTNTKTSVESYQIADAQQRLEEQEALLQCGSWSNDLLTGKVQWSPGLYSLFGYSPEELEGRLSNAWFVAEVMHPEDAMMAADAYQHAVSTGATTSALQFRARHKQGHWLVCKVNYRLYYDEAGRPLRSVAVTRDVSVDVESAYALELFRTQQTEREAFLQFGSWETELNSGKIWWSEGMWHLYDYPVQDRPEVSVDLYSKHVEPADLAYAQANLQQQLKDTGRYEWVYTVTTFTGRKKRLLSSGKYLHDTPGKPLKIIGLTKDVTQQEEYEQSMRIKIGELARSNQELEEFAYVASHDLQEPLRKMTTFAERLQNRFTEVLGTDGNMYVGRIISAADNMRRLIDNLLEFSRISRVERNYQPVDLNKLVRKVVLDFEVQAEEAGAQIVVGSLPTVDGLELPLEQLMANLFSNAIKFRNKQKPLVIKVCAVMATQSQKQSAGMQKPQVVWALQVEDNGIGFEQEYAEKIFAMFQRLHGKVEYPGSGMGLSICRKIAEIHHGKLVARGIPGEGATFTFYLPQQQEAKTT